MAAHTLTKRERLCSLKLANQLFSEAGSHSMVAYPVRVVWMEKEREEQEPPVPQHAVHMAFIWLSDDLYSSAEVADRMEKMIQRLAERL